MVGLGGLNGPHPTGKPIGKGGGLRPPPNTFPVGGCRLDTKNRRFQDRFLKNKKLTTSGQPPYPPHNIPHAMQYRCRASYYVHQESGSQVGAPETLRNPGGITSHRTPSRKPHTIACEALPICWKLLNVVKKSRRSRRSAWDMLGVICWELKLNHVVPNYSK
jgi:hypothetical protein